MASSQPPFASTHRRLGWNTPGIHFMLVGALFFAMSIGTLVWSAASDWIHHRQQQGSEPTETLPDRFDLTRPAAVPVPRAP